MKLIRRCICTYNETYELNLNEAFLAELNERLAEYYEMKSDITLSDVVDVLEERYNPDLDVEGVVNYIGYPTTLREALKDIINTKVWSSDPDLEYIGTDYVSDEVEMSREEEMEYLEQDEEEQEDEEDEEEEEEE